MDSTPSNLPNTVNKEATSPWPNIVLEELEELEELDDQASAAICGGLRITAADVTRNSYLSPNVTGG